MEAPGGGSRGGDGPTRGLSASEEMAAITTATGWRRHAQVVDPSDRALRPDGMLLRSDQRPGTDRLMAEARLGPGGAGTDAGGR